MAPIIGSTVPEPQSGFCALPCDSGLAAVSHFSLLKELAWLCPDGTLESILVPSSPSVLGAPGK
jgi:hypothetical protein